MQLIIGNKKYSFWSLRPWLAMKVLGVTFEEKLSQFDMSTTSENFYEFSPSKKVPVLIGGAAWNTYCAAIETLPDYQGWANEGRAEPWVVKEVEIG